MSSPRRPPGPPYGPPHGAMAPGPSVMHGRKHSSSSGSSPVGSTRSVVFEDQDPLLPHHHKRHGGGHGTPRHHQSKAKQPLANQRKWNLDCLVINWTFSCRDSYAQWSKIQILIEKFGLKHFDVVVNMAQNLINLGFEFSNLWTVLSILHHCGI